MVGPLFISIGDEEKLNLFLDKNPYIPRDQAFVDDMVEFGAYKAAGFGRFDDTDPDLAKVATRNMGAPDLGGIRGWWNYFNSVIKLSPIPPKQQGQGAGAGGMPEGVLRLGGTFVVSGNDIVYQWNDRIPGDHPNIEEVFQIAQTVAKAATKSPSSSANNSSVINNNGS